MDFSYATYKNIVDLLHENHYEIADFKNYNQFKRPAILRHDIDFSIEDSYNFSLFEDSLGVKSTYFVLLATGFYNPMLKENRIMLKDMLKRGFGIGLHYDTTAYEGDMAASIQHLAVRFPVARNFFGKIVDYFYAVNGVSLTIKEGKTLGLVGESGSGKTTLGLAMAGLIESVGKIFVKGQNIRDISHKELHKKIQIVFQDPYTSLNPRMNVSEIVGEGIKVHFPQLSKKEKDARICQVLQEVGLKSNCLEKYPHEFSGGQRQRIAIARALVVEPEILILDEPTSALDVTIAAQILKLLQKIQETRGISYLFISHDMRAVRALADDIAVMKDGKIIEFSSATQLFENPKQTYTRRLIYSADLEKKERRGLKQTHKG